MTREAIHRLSGRVPVAMSLLGLAIVLAVVGTGWQRRLPDEGAAAHLFQLLVVAQAPLILLFLATADWKRWREPAAWLGLQAGALALALAPVAYFRL